MRFVRIIGILIFAAAAAFEVLAQDHDRPIAAATGVQAERGDLSKSVQIFPNPVAGESEYVYVRFDLFKAQDIRLVVHNIIGNEVPAEIEVTSEYEIRIRVKDLSSGYYLLSMKDKTSRFQSTLKFLKK
jgi:hypothetical protein